MISPPTPMPLFNAIGFATLFRMEYRRYVKAWQHSIAAPVITTLLFFAIFDLTLGGARADIDGVPYLHFVAPGLISMTIMLTAFEMSAWAAIDAKIRGTLDALVSAPLRPIEFTAAPVLANAAAGLTNGVIVLIVMQPFVPIMPQAPLVMLLFAVAGAITMAAAGMAAGIYAEKFDHVATIVGFAVTPAMFLSGVFFTIGAYGGVLTEIARISPFFWVIDGIRQGFVGVGEVPLWIVALLSWALTALAVAGLCTMVARGYRLKR